MDRPYSISDFALPFRWDSESGPSVVERASRSSRNDRPHGHADRDKHPDSVASRGFDRSRTIYRGREREYSLRNWKCARLDVGSFALCRTDDLARFGTKAIRLTWRLISKL